MKILTRQFDKYDLFITIGVAIYIIFFSYLSLFNLSILQMGQDLAIFNQSFWTTLHGGGFLENTFEGVSHFGYHFSPILFFLFPFYMLIPGPEILLIFQSIFLGLGAIPFYLCGRELLNKKAGFVVGIIYLLYPAVHGINLFAFHELAFLPFFLGIALWGFITGRKNLCFIFCILSLLIKEDVTLIIGMIGVIGVWKGRTLRMRENWQHIILLILSIVIFVVYLFIIKPSFGLADSSDSSLEIIQYTNPLENLASNNDLRFSFLIQLFTPLLLTPLASPEILLICIPSFIEIFFATPGKFIYYNIFSHYPALVIPIVFVSMIVTLRKIKENSREKIRKAFFPFLILILLSSVITTALWSPVISQIIVLNYNYSPQFCDDVDKLEVIADCIPPSASVSTQWQLLTLMSQRYSIWEGYHPNADVILLYPYYNGANIFSNYKKEIVSNYDQVDIGKSFYLFIRKGHYELKDDIKDKLNNAGIAINSS
ncbi:DUF2079 domain-containing protein [uncultured Methanospirillum sp.]|uniref:DUF2079 domain-containing protein n=1 Tax=uncultured Methanospirillum sp. TaxID=262503 RepID=UPI0029C792DD|nr:DUF2079 domain-containing protein [uncultured Methanospirillum sp.]